MRFAAPWDRTLKVTTTLSVLVGVGAFLLAYTWLGSGSGLLVAAIVVTHVLSWAFAPRAYAIEGGRLRIERPLLPVDVPLAAIRAARPLAEEDFRGARRVLGSGGLFGYYGRYWSRRLGSFRLLATRRRWLVLVDSEVDRFVLSPEPPDRFLDAVLSRAPGAAREDPGAPIAPRRTPRRAWLGLGALVALVTLTVAGAAFLLPYAWAPQGVRLEGDAIHVEGRLFSPVVVIPLADVRRVERLPAEASRGFHRVSGASPSSGVRYGVFRSRELGDFRLYAWREGPAVVLDTLRERFVVTPDDPETFVSDVRAALAQRR